MLTSRYITFFFRKESNAHQRPVFSNKTALACIPVFRSVRNENSPSIILQAVLNRFGAQVRANAVVSRVT